MIREIRKRMTSQRGFTLVELMVVIAIIGVLAAIAIPKFSATTATAKDAKLEADLRTTDSVLMMYYADKKVYPDTLETVKTYFSSGAVPTDAKGAALNYILTGDKSAYKLSGVKSKDDSTVYSPGSDKTIPNPSN